MSTDAYKLRLDRPLDREIARLVRSQVSRARRALKTADDTGVHTARKALKRARAVLRLIRGGLPRERYRSFDQQLKLIGRRLAGVRDMAVAVSLTEILTVEGKIKQTIAKPLSEFLSEERAAVWSTLRADGGIEAIRDELNGLRLTQEELTGMDALALHGGLAWTYSRGRECLAHAVEFPSADSLHAWRRHAKHYGYQIRLLTRAWPLVLRSEARAIDRLTEALGDDHDLSELGRLAKLSNIDKSTLQSLQRVVRKRRKELLASVWPLGACIYAEDAWSVASRMTVYLTVGIAQESGAPIHPLNGMALLARPNHPLITVP